jgi:hypothetical protein
LKKLSRCRICASVSFQSLNAMSPRGHVVDAFGSLDVRLHELLGHRVVDAHELVALRSGPRPLRDLRPIDSAKVELVHLHGEPCLRADRGGEGFTGRHAVGRLGDHREVIALAVERPQDASEERTTKTAAPVLRFDRDLRPADVRVLGVLEIPRSDAVAGEPASTVSRNEDRAPLSGWPGAQPLRDDPEGRRRVLWSLLDRELLPELGDLLHLRVSRGLQIDRHDRVVVRRGHGVEPSAPG